MGGLCLETTERDGDQGEREGGHWRIGLKAPGALQKA